MRRNAKVHKLCIDALTEFTCLLDWRTYPAAYWDFAVSYPKLFDKYVRAHPSQFPAELVPLDVYTEVQNKLDPSTRKHKDVISHMQDFLQWMNKSWYPEVLSKFAVGQKALFTKYVKSNPDVIPVELVPQNIRTKTQDQLEFQEWFEKVNLTGQRDFADDIIHCATSTLTLTRESPSGKREDLQVKPYLVGSSIQVAVGQNTHRGCRWLGVPSRITLNYDRKQGVFVCLATNFWLNLVLDVYEPCVFMFRLCMRRLYRALYRQTDANIMRLVKQYLYGTGVVHPVPG